MVALSAASGDQAHRIRIWRSKSCPERLTKYSLAANLWVQALASVGAKQQPNRTSMYNTSFLVQEV